MISVGTLVAFEAMFVSMGYALTDLTQFVPTLAQAAGSIEHLDEIFREEPSISDPPDPPALPRMEHAIVLGSWPRRFKASRSCRPPSKPSRLGA